MSRVRLSLRPAPLLVAAFALLTFGVALNLLAASASRRRLVQLEQQVAHRQIDAQVVARQSAAEADGHGRLERLNFLILAAAGLLAAVAWGLRSPSDRQLYDWVTVCAWTRRVQWNGRWISFEEFLAQRYDVHCTHGICDEEAEKLRQL